MCGDRFKPSRLGIGVAQGRRSGIISHENRKNALKRLKAAESEVIAWNKKVRDDVNKMLNQLEKETLARHNRLQSRYVEKGGSRDSSLVGIDKLQKDLKSVMKQLSKTPVDRETASKSILEIAEGIGLIRRGLNGIQNELVEAREREKQVSTLVNNLVETVNATRLEWEQEIERFDGIYAELEIIPTPKKLLKLESAFALSRPDILLARQEDNSPESIKNWRERLEEILGKTMTFDEEM